MAQFWSSLGPTAITLTVTFRGLLLSTGTGAPGVGGYPAAVLAPTLDIMSGVGYGTLSATALLSDVTLRPAGKWTRIVSTIDPDPPAAASASAKLTGAWFHYGKV